MAIEPTLRDRVTAVLSSVTPGQLTNVKQFNEQLNELVMQAAAQGAQAIREGRDLDDFKERHPQLFSEGAQSPRRDISKTYRHLHREHVNLCDLIKQQARANTRDHAKGFAFLVLRAAAIAAIVLTTYWLGNELEIPLPMRMPII